MKLIYYFRKLKLSKKTHKARKAEKGSNIICVRKHLNADVLNKAK